MSRIQKVAGFLYSSKSSNVVPLRINVSDGMCGWGLDKDAFIELMTILMESPNLKKDLGIFRNEISGE